MIMFNPESQKMETLNFIMGSNDSETITGTTGNDYLFGGSGDDVINGGDGNDMIGSGWGDVASTGNDIINGGEGNDFIWADYGENVLHGDRGHDNIVVENTNNNKLYGDAGDDTLEAYGTGHELYGGAGNDTLISHNGSLMSGGTGNDTLSGGSGSDTFKYLWNVDQNSDTVISFDNGMDHIMVDNAPSASTTESNDGINTFIYFDESSSYIKVSPGGNDGVDTLITFSDTEATQITLKGVLSDTIHADDFTFIV